MKFSCSTIPPSAGITAVSSAVNATGVREILSPSWQNGVLVKSFNIEAYADGLLRLMSDGELRDRVADNGLKHVSEFSEERTAKQWIGMINNLLQ